MRLKGASSRPVRLAGLLFVMGSQFLLALRPAGARRRPWLEPGRWPTTAAGVFLRGAGRHDLRGVTVGGTQFRRAEHRRPRYVLPGRMLLVFAPEHALVPLLQADHARVRDQYMLSSGGPRRRRPPVPGADHLAQQHFVDGFSSSARIRRFDLRRRCTSATSLAPSTTWPRCCSRRLRNKAGACRSTYFRCLVPSRRTIGRVARAHVGDGRGQRLGFLQFGFQIIGRRPMVRGCSSCSSAGSAVLRVLLPLIERVSVLAFHSIETSG